MKVELDQSEIPISLHRNTLFIGGLIAASLTYSKTTKKWYMHMKGFSDSLYELNSQGECIEACKKEFIEFLNDLK